MKIFKWGIIGPGDIAGDFAEDLMLMTDQQHVIHSILSHTEKTGGEFAEKFNVQHVYFDISEFLTSDINAVYIATPHTLHYEQALACLKSKVPVLCEKPVTINADQLRHLVETARANNTFLMEGMWIRFLPSIQQVMQLIHENTIGDVVSVKANMSYRAPYIESNRYFNPDLGGGSLLDLGIYPLFLATLIFGKPAKVKSVAALSDKGIDEACSILLDYPDKQYAVLESSLITELELSAEIAGIKGKIKILPPWNETPEAIQLDIYDEYKVTYPCKWKGRGFQFEIEEMMRCLQAELIESDLMPHRLSLQVMEIMDEVRGQVHIKYESFE